MIFVEFVGPTQCPPPSLWDLTTINDISLKFLVTQPRTRNLYAFGTGSYIGLLLFIFLLTGLYASRKTYSFLYIIIHRKYVNHEQVLLRILLFLFLLFKKQEENMDNLIFFKCQNVPFFFFSFFGGFFCERQPHDLLP